MVWGVCRRISEQGPRRFEFCTAMGFARPGKSNQPRIELSDGNGVC